MIWLLLAALGIPLWTVAGALIATFLSRRAFKRAPGVFPAKLRLIAGELEHLGPSWPRRSCYARWVHDVLVVNRGVALVRTTPLPVAGVEGFIGSPTPAEPRGPGPDPLTLALVLDNGAQLQLGASRNSREAMVGPFAKALL